MANDASLGWDDVADRFIAIRSSVGGDLVRSWARDALRPSSRILDLGCGSGIPITKTLVGEGYEVFGIDASPSLLIAFKRNFPGCPAKCEPVQDSDLFDCSFSGIVAIGLVFLLNEGDQRKLLTKVSCKLEPGGRFFFSAPRQACEWRDTLTCRPSISLGEDAYVQQLSGAGMRLVACHVDEGDNNYFDMVKGE